MTNFAQTTETEENLAYYRREVVETFERAITTLDDMVENSGKTGDDLNRLRNKARALETVWNRQGDRIENAKSLNDLAAIIGFIYIGATDPKLAADGEREGIELAISYLRQFARYLPEN